MPRLRRALTAAAVLLLLTTAVATAHEGDPDEIEQELEATRDQLSEAQSGLETIRGQVGDAQQRLAAADRELVELTAELREREAELAVAEADLADSRARTRAATSRLRELNAELDDTEAALTEHRRRFDSRVANTYKHGGPLGYTEALFAAENVPELAHSMYLVRSVMRADERIIEEVEGAAARIEDLRGEADTVRDDLAAEESARAAAAAEVERATRAQQRLTEMVADERERRQRLVAELEADRVAYQQLVASLEEESARLEQELAESRYAANLPTGDLLWPTNGVLTSRYGYRTHPIFGTRRLHAGIDISGGTGQPIVAAAPGRVVSATWRGGYGLAVVIDHGGGLATLYAHQSRLVVSRGEIVESGQKIGEVGSTGFSTGPHLHFETRVDGVPRDPMQYYGG